MKNLDVQKISYSYIYYISQLGGQSSTNSLKELKAKAKFYGYTGICLRIKGNGKNSGYSFIDLTNN